MSKDSAQTSFLDDPAAVENTAQRVGVLVPYPVDKAYDYAVPEGEDFGPGDYVCVPLGNREIPGVVWGEAAGDVASSKVKSAVFQYDLPPMPKVQRDFIDWLAGYTLGARGAVLKMALSVPGALEEGKAQTGYRFCGAPRLIKLSEAQRKVADLMQDGQVRRAAEIAQDAAVSAAVVKGLVRKGILETVELRTSAPCRFPDFKRDGAVLSPEQRGVADILCEDVRSGAFRASLLDGVTGAGKTEVYFEGVAEALAAGRQVLLLLPEIALSNAFLARFQARFGCAPALWHSNLTPAQRRSTWRGVATGETRVVVGARSALLLPYADLGLIIVDEEHDPAYKQEDGVIYHARDMAVVRASLGKIPVVLVSATPSLETMQNVWEGRYRHLHLPDRYGGARLPDVELVDMRLDKPERGNFLARAVLEGVHEALEGGGQALLFLNRRGYAPLTLCRACGHRFECPRCTAWLVEHRKTGRLHCHHCGFHEVVPKACPSCGEADTLTACGPGVERVFEEISAAFPQARTVILASDMAENNAQLKDMLEKIAAHEVDIIVGTQIIAKGHHFPDLTFVGVVDADLGLQGGDLRAAERTYQLLHQVSGRAGRAEKAGRVMIQSWMPDHPVMQALAGAAGRDDFLNVEASEREAAGMPPFSRLCAVIVSGREETVVQEVAKALGRCSPQGANDKGHRIQTLGPAPAPLARLRGKYRYRLLVRADKRIHLQKVVAGWIAGVKVPSTVRVAVDIDPQSFL
ncbi:MAG: primosomal protein N' [Alphaproteobacteria bacterium]|nr:primosomal protein N' [Alphaproteobacteria bacterium]